MDDFRFGGANVTGFSLTATSIAAATEVKFYDIFVSLAVCMVTEIIFVIGIQQLIIPPENNVFQRNLVIGFAIYRALGLRNYIPISLHLTFLLGDVLGVTFFTGHDVVNTVHLGYMDCL